MEVQNHQIIHPLLAQNEVELFVKREDLLHPYISGNKFRKLKYNILEAQKQKKSTLLTFGGAYSNHIQATASAGKKHGFSTIGIIRGDELGKDIDKTLSENSTLAFAVREGMQLHFVSREVYKGKESKSFIENLRTQFGDFYLVPEGGTNKLAIKGCEEILHPSDVAFNYICCAVGTGGTVLGLINSAKERQKVIGYPVLKAVSLQQKIQQNTESKNWNLSTKYHFGGYAKIKPKLIEFINEFYQNQKIPLDPIYTGKLLFGIFEDIKSGKFNKKSRILAIHTGGIQGIAGMNTKLKKKNQTQIRIDYEF